MNMTVKELEKKVDDYFKNTQPEQIEKDLISSGAKDACMTVEEIVKKYLQENGYDGLADDECGCGLNDFIPCKDACGIDISDCVPAYEKICGCGDHFYTEDKTRTDCYTCRDWEENEF